MEDIVDDGVIWCFLYKDFFGGNLVYVFFFLFCCKCFFVCKICMIYCLFFIELLIYLVVEDLFVCKIKFVVFKFVYLFVLLFFVGFFLFYCGKLIIKKLV